MASPTPPATVLQFLEMHLAQGSLAVHAFDMLRGVVRMTNRISHLLFPHSHIFREDARQQIVALCNGVEATCAIFGEQPVMRCNRAFDARSSLPSLDCNNEADFYEAMRKWREVIRTLHEPNRNDTTMYRMIYMHFDDYVFAPFLQLHRLQPDHGSWRLYGRLNIVRDNLIDLHSVCRKANELVSNLDREHDKGKLVLDRMMTIPTRPSVAVEHAMPSIPESDEDVEALAHMGSALSTLEALDDFFETGDAASVHSSHSSLLEMRRYNIDQGTATPPMGRSTSSRSSGIPRVFTGSFEELASSVKQLGLADGKDTANHEHVKIKDFAMRTPCLLPSPATLLERREAIVRREADWDQRVVVGESFRSRRPSGKHRAMTIDDRSGSLEAWLTAPSPDKAARVRQRQHTL